MAQTLKQYMNGAKETLNSMKPFSEMKDYAKIEVRIKIARSDVEIVHHPWKASGFDFFDTFKFSSYYVKRNDEMVAVPDLKFKSMEIIDKGLIVEVE